MCSSSLAAAGAAGVVTVETQKAGAVAEPGASLLCLIWPFRLASTQLLWVLAVERSVRGMIRPLPVHQLRLVVVMVGQYTLRTFLPVLAVQVVAGVAPALLVRREL